MTARDFLARLEGVVQNGAGWKAKCPAHEDTNPSLSVGQGEDGRILVNCFAGCSVQDIVAALGLTQKDLFPATYFSAAPEIVAVYDYQDARGHLSYQVVRQAPKAFRQRRPDPDHPGEYLWSTKGLAKVLFRLPYVIAQVADGGTVFVVEGEKDALALVANGFCATCNPGGAGKWAPDYTQTLADADVVVIPDKDPPGRNHAQAVASTLQGRARRVRLLELPDLNGHAVKDAYDYFAAGGQAVDLDDLVERTPDWSPQPSKPEPWLELVSDGAVILTKELPPVVEIIEGLVPEQSKTVLAASSKSYKSWLLMNFAVAVAQGIPVLGRQTLRRRVLYLNLELRPLTFERRLQAITQAKGIQLEPGWFIHLPLRGQLAKAFAESPGGFFVDQIMTRLISLTSYLQAAVIFLDPIYKLNLEGCENDSREQTLFFNELDRLTTEAGCTLMFTDHFPKGNQSEKDPLDAIRGSSAKGGDVDAGIILRQHELPDCYRVDVRHRELPPVPEFVIGWNFPLMELRPDLDPADMRKVGGRPKEHSLADLLSCITDTSPTNPISISAWAEAAGVSRTTLIGYLRQMRIRGWIATAGHGNNARQFITQSGLAYVS